MVQKIAFVQEWEVNTIIKKITGRIYNKTLNTLLTHFLKNLFGFHLPTLTYFLSTSQHTKENHLKYFSLFLTLWKCSYCVAWDEIFPYIREKWDEMKRESEPNHPKVHLKHGKTRKIENMKRSLASKFSIRG